MSEKRMVASPGTPLTVLNHLLGKRSQNIVREALEVSRMEEAIIEMIDYAWFGAVGAQKCQSAGDALGAKQIGQQLIIA